eukprot:CAMPEP_0178450440 /NCGR_PEP_ID=MMETSP0689_2-20121128/43127_1 /TAXON_ID=160604 /ORGANISM="Amphidinium massartii, Strain CS-259" /LENGTH=97 /DNA_ID=CAMNT_0020075909 /DNA_START=364 /DNA_END=658 /DNA_ORIENTATION=-
MRARRLLIAFVWGLRALFQVPALHSPEPPKLPAESETPPDLAGGRQVEVACPFADSCSPFYKLFSASFRPKLFKLQGIDHGETAALLKLPAIGHMPH